MKKYFLVALLFSLFSAQLNSTAPFNKHVVKKGDSLYSISKEYGLKVNDIVKANPALAKSQNIKIGQHLVIPAGNNKLQAISYKHVSVPSTPDTPYREEDTRQRTSIPQPMKPMLQIQESVAENAKPVTAPIVASSPAQYPAVFNQYPTQGYKIKKNKGAANYINDATSGNQNLAFYNDAESGSIVRVTNLMNHRTVFVKVIGRVPPMDASKEITIKLSNKSAQDLGALDEKFLVEVASYSSN